MPLAAPVTRTVNPLTERLSCLKSDMGYSLMMRRLAGLTRLAPIRRQVKPTQKRTGGARDERTGFQRQAGSRGRRLQRHRQRHRAGVPRQGRARACLRHPRFGGGLFGGRGIASRWSGLRAARRQRRPGDREIQAVVRPARRAGAGAGRGDLPARRIRNGRISQGARSQPDEPDGLRRQIPCHAECSQGLADHRQFDRRLSFDQRQSGLQRLEDRRDGADPHARARPGPRTASASTASRPASSIPR